MVVDAALVAFFDALGRRVAHQLRQRFRPRRRLELGHAAARGAGLRLEQQAHGQELGAVHLPRLRDHLLVPELARGVEQRVRDGLEEVGPGQVDVQDPVARHDRELQRPGVHAEAVSAEANDVAVFFEQVRLVS